MEVADETDCKYSFVGASDNAPTDYRAGDAICGHEPPIFQEGGLKRAHGRADEHGYQAAWAAEGEIMIALLGSLLGLFGSAVPELFKWFQDKRDKAFELQMLEAQAKNAAALREYDAKMFSAQADASFYTAEQDRLAKQQMNDRTGIRWVDATNAMVRPVIALGFLALYCIIKILVVWNLGIDAVIDRPWLIWSDEDSGTFATVISFYFGSRALRNTMGRK